MIADLQNYTIEEIKQGYAKEKGGFRCLCCGRWFEEGEIFPINGHYYQAKKAVEVHLANEHADYFDELCAHISHGCTPRQIELLKYMKQGYKDNEIAQMTGIAAATIRHQRFVLKEKARQARNYLAVVESVFDVKAESAFVNVHEGAKMVDERYCVTNDEEEKAVQNLFVSMEPLKLKQWPAKDKKKILALRKIVECFEKGREYNEREVNVVLKEIFEDIATLRRALIEFGFMDRSADCRHYWRK